MHADHARIMASYNRWMNERLYAVCAELSDDERKADSGAFFGSIHGTLNHLLLGDRVWIGRFTGKPFSVSGLDQELYSDFSELRSQREITDSEIESWASELTEEMLGEKLVVTSIVFPGTRSYDMWVCVAHFFNHQTHHRGQLTTLLAQAGRDYGVTDLTWLPNVVAEAEK
jgi:uncharacterized damage-inducible protein DinB